MNQLKKVKVVWFAAALCCAAHVQAATWINMSGGSWNDPNNWSGGVPDGTPAYLTSTAASYLVTVGAPPLGVVHNMTLKNDGPNTTRLDIAASGFTVSNGTINIGRGAEICVTDGGVWSYTGRTPILNLISIIDNGGLLRIDGGTVDFSNLMAATEPDSASRMFVGHLSEGRMAVTSGKFSMSGVSTENETNKSAQFYLGNNVNGYGHMEVSGTGSVDFRDGWGTTIYIGNYYGHGHMEVSDTGSVRFGGGSLNIGNRDNSYGHLAVSDAGSVAFESGPLYIGNGAGAYGHLEVSDTGSVEFKNGSLLYIGNAAGAYGHLEVSGTGRVAIANELVSMLYIGGSSYATGMLELKDQAEFEFLSSTKTAYIASSAGSTGRVSVAGNSKFIMPVILSSYSFYTGDGANSLAEITICDDGLMDVYGGNSFYMGSPETLGRSVLTIKDRGYFEAGGGLRMCPVISGKTGYAEINLEGGTLSITNGTNNGLYVGQASGTGNGFSRACMNMSGGFLSLMKDYFGYKYGARDGILVALVRKGSGGGALGDFNLSGGAITNFGALTLGLGQGATGTLHQTGGHLEQGRTKGNVLRNVVLGWGGGWGSYHMSGGTALIYDPVFVGGVTTNQLPDKCDPNAFTMDKACTGLLRVDGGSFKVINNHTLYCGSSGVGTIIIGSNGVCEAKNIVLTNNTQSVVRFELGEQGCGILRATDTLKIYGDTRLEVDTRAYKGIDPGVKLIDHGSRTGEFAPENIIVTGVGKVFQKPTGVWVYKSRGTVLLIK